MFSVVMSLAVLSLVAIIPMVGLTVDVGYLYASKARLQAAVDGASLAAARSLNLGANISAQSVSAKQNAVNWFYSNFPPGNWATHNTVMAPANVEVFDDPNNPQLRNVRVTASTRVPTYFMKWFNIQSTQISAVGNANRRDVVVMMVLDRSSSMTGTACSDLRAAALLFTGQFAAGRDRIGMVTFSDGVFQQAAWAPSTNFRTVLGYNTGTASGAGAIDNIVCAGGTNTAAAITVGYNELYKTNLPGAYNILLLETDGLPNSLSMRYWDSTRTHPNKSAMANLGASTGCGDGQSPTARPRGWSTGSGASQRWGWGRDSDGERLWSTTKAFGGFLGTFNPGAIGTIWSVDPATATTTTGTFQAMMSPWFTNASMAMTQTGTNSSKYLPSGTPSGITNATTIGCDFNGATRQSDDFIDFKWLPRTDIYGNDVNPSFAYKAVEMVTNDTNPVVTTVPANQKYLRFHTDGTTPNNITTPARFTRWWNFHNAAINATDHAAFRARQGHNGNIPVTVNVIGLGAVSDFPLMQRLANDPNCDKYNQPIDANGCGPSYPAYNMPAAFNTQMRGTFVYSANSNELRRAFLSLSSQILRLSQ